MSMTKKSRLACALAADRHARVAGRILVGIAVEDAIARRAAQQQLGHGRGSLPPFIGDPGRPPLDPHTVTGSCQLSVTTFEPGHSPGFWYAPQRNEARPADQLLQWPGGPEAIGPTLAQIVRQADDVGFDSIWVMDHFFQIRGLGGPEEPMLEGWTDARLPCRDTSRARLGLMVGGVHYRYPGCG